MSKRTCEARKLLPASIDFFKIMCIKDKKQASCMRKFSGKRIRGSSCPPQAKILKKTSIRDRKSMEILQIPKFQNLKNLKTQNHKIPETQKLQIPKSQ